MNKILMFSIFATMMVSVASVSLAEATYSTNWGYVRDSGSSGVNPAKVTFEKAGEYEWYDVNVSSGFYNESLPDGSTGWTVSAMASGYDRDVKTNINEGTRNDFHIDTRNMVTIKFKVAYDTTTGVTVTEARDELRRAEPWFEDEHGLNFAVNESTSWTSSGQSKTNCFDVLRHAESDTNWDSGNYGTSDILAAFSDGHMSNSSSKACGDVPTSGGTHPAFYVDIRTSDSEYHRDRRVAHELTHNYGFDHLSTCTNAVPGLMSVTDTTHCNYIINWSPSNDIILESRRNWY